MRRLMADNFGVTVGVCTYAAIKTRAVMSHFALEKCPNPKIMVRYQDGDALIGRSRSLIANRFLKDTSDELLMFLDEDVVISTEDATKLMWEAHTLKLPIVGAAYCTKSKDNPGLAIRPLADTDKIEFGKNGAIVEMRSISTGCMVIRREVFHAMITSEKIKYCKHRDRGYYPFFQDVQKEIDGTWEHLSEDWFFTEIARELGFKIYCDTTIKLGHIGAYEYTFDDILETRNGQRKKYDSVTFNLGNRKEPDFSVSDLTGTRPKG